jgi:hypothetical protein
MLVLEVYGQLLVKGLLSPGSGVDGSAGQYKLIESLRAREMRLDSRIQRPRHIAITIAHTMIEPRG